MSIYEKIMKKYRVGNIEVRKSKYGEDRYEVVEWSKNTYYGKESEYEFDGEKYHFAMASLDEKTFLYTTQVDNKPMEVIKSFSEQDEIAQFWKFKNFGKKD